MRGDLAIAGMPGLVLAPEEGFNLPAIAFGHHWLTSPERYLTTLKHLASWGFVVVAPSTERGVVPSALNFAADLDTALAIATDVRLGPGRLSVKPSKLAFVGHGFGAGAAMLAAQRRKDRPVAAVSALFPTPVSPSAEKAARQLTMPALVLAAELKSLTSNARALAENLAGDTILRTIEHSSTAGLIEGHRISTWFGLGKSEKKTQSISRALLTGFLLHQVDGDKTYAAFADPAAEFKRTLVVDPYQRALPEDEFDELLSLPPAELAGAPSRTELASPAEQPRRAGILG
nr:hypothetical protein [Lolliginicoccus lacisalsi]